MEFFSHNSWLGSENRYITRPAFTAKQQWIVRIGKNLNYSINKTFNDSDYGSKTLAFKAAKMFRDDAIKALSRSQKNTLRDGLPKYKTGAGITHINRRTRLNKVSHHYCAKCFNKYTGKLLTKTIIYGRRRTKAQAYALAQQWRLAMVQDICKMGENLGIVKI